MKLSNEQLAYLAGFIDAEASVECQKQMQKHGKTPRYSLRLSITLATEEPLKTFTSWFESSYKKYPATDAKRSPRYRMHIPKGVAIGLLTACLPFFLLKRRQAEIILEIESVRARFSPKRKHFRATHFKQMPVIAITKMEKLFRELRSLKSNKRAMHCRINKV